MASAAPVYNPLAQASRYLVVGGALAALYGGIYALLAVGAQLPPLAANLMAWLSALVTGYVLHSAWSFRGHAGRGAVSTPLRYVTINVAGFLMNSFWVWLIVSQLGAPRLWPLLPILLLTPALCFLANRRFVFPMAAGVP